MMLYQINDSTYAGAYIKLECIQSILPNYSIKDMEKYNYNTNRPTLKNRPEPVSYTIVLYPDRDLFCLDAKDYQDLKKVLIKEGLLLPNQQKKTKRTTSIEPILEEDWQ